jgi:cellulose synthase/poly-beta-1,6-N-acetylglucosamine synthase-like glycosyltransferase
MAGKTDKAGRDRHFPIHLIAGNRFSSTHRNGDADALGLRSMTWNDNMPVIGTQPDHVFVVPAYKESPFLRSCLVSLRAQTMASRIIVTTSTPCAYIDRLANEFDVLVVVNPVRRGIGADWNFGLAQTACRFLTLAHQDDVYAPDFLKQSLDLFARHPRATLTFTNYQEISDAGAARKSKVSVVKDALLGIFAGRCELIRGRRGRMLLSFGNPISCSSITFDREKLGTFRFHEDLGSNLDWFAWLSLIERGDCFAYDRERLVSRRYNDLTETNLAIRDGRRRSEDELILSRLWPWPVSRLIARAYTAGY